MNNKLINSDLNQIALVYHEIKKTRNISAAGFDRGYTYLFSNPFSTELLLREGSISRRGKNRKRQILTQIDRLPC